MRHTAMTPEGVTEMTTDLSYGSRLTTDSGLSSYGIPVLELDDYELGTGRITATHTLGMGDNLPHRPEHTAGEYVRGWLARSTEPDFDRNVRGADARLTVRGTLDEAQALARRFCGF
jgi:hypothetical protein